MTHIPESIQFHTRILSIIGNVLRIALPKSVDDSPSLGELAEVRDENGGLRVAQVVELDDEVASLQVFSGTQELATRAKVRKPLKRYHRQGVSSLDFQTCCQTRRLHD